MFKRMCKFSRISLKIDIASQTAFESFSRAFQHAHKSHLFIYNEKNDIRQWKLLRITKIELYMYT